MAARTESALAIGRRFRARLNFLICSPYQQFIPSDPFGGMDLAREDVPWDVAIADGDALAALSLGATLADLAIVSLGARDRRGLAGPAGLRPIRVSAQR